MHKLFRYLAGPTGLVESFLHFQEGGVVRASFFLSSPWILDRRCVVSIAKDGKTSESKAVLPGRFSGAGALSSGALPRLGRGAAGAVQASGNGRPCGRRPGVE